MADAIRWGIIGTGAIAKKFAADLKTIPNARLLAVGSRSPAGAQAFGKEFDIVHRHTSYEALAANPEIDCVYIATPHPFHYENAILCLNAGKAVLCEKPFALNVKQAEEVIQLARRKKILLMEAMWTRCFPIMHKLRELLAKQCLGEVQIVTADFGFRAEFDSKSRLFDPHLGGGALLDVGVYPLSFASMILGSPKEITGVGILGKTHVDEQTSITLKYHSDALAILHTSIRANTSCEATVIGTRGCIRIHSPFWKPSRMTIALDGKNEESIDLPYPGHGYHFEATEFMNCLRHGKVESPVMPLDETISILRTMDTLRGQIGVKYPME